MNLLSVITAAVGCALAGCASLSDVGGSVRDRVAARGETRARTFDAPQRATYDAVRAAARLMGYRFVRGGAAQGRLEAVSGIARSDTGSRQLALKAEIEPNPEGGTQVSVRFTEIIESDPTNRPGQATETALRDTPQYEVFFRSVQQALDSPNSL